MNDEAASGTPVVTCFLLRDDRGRDEILLVLRSARVRTYQGAWGGISGYVERDVAPLDQAYTELAEETGLTRADVRLLRTGAPLAFRDEAAGQAWVVHPFLFAVAHPERVRLDWEATESRWVHPDEVARLPGVPQLAEALAAVYPLGDAGDGPE